jgi:glutathione S-transferase
MELSMYKLYYSPGACSMAIHVILNELNQKYEAINANGPHQTRTPEFLKISPRGVVPVLQDGAHTIKEGAAIMLHLLGKHKNDLLPESGFERAEALEWLMFANATLHPAYARGFFALKNLTGEAQQRVIELTVQQINTLWKEVDTKLAKSEYVCGKQLSPADILLTVIANWSGRFNGIEFGENSKRLFRTVIARPSYKKALEAENVEYKAAA